MRAGRLNKLVTFQRETVSADTGGGGAASWANLSGLVSIHAQFMPERGRERIAAGRIEAGFAGVLKLRSFAALRAVTEKDRVLIDDVPHQIRSIVNPDGRSAEIEMLVERGAAS